MTVDILSRRRSSVGTCTSGNVHSVRDKSKPTNLHSTHVPLPFWSPLMSQCLLLQFFLQSPTEHHDYIMDLGSWFDYVDCALVTQTPPPPASRSAVQTSNPHPSGHHFRTTAVPLSQPQSASIYHSQAMHERMATVGIALLVYSVANGCPYTAAALVQDMLLVGHRCSWILATCAEGSVGSMTLLQHAQASGCPDTLRLVLDLGHGDSLSLAVLADLSTGTACEDHVPNDGDAGQLAVPRAASGLQPAVGSVQQKSSSTMASSARAKLWLWLEKYDPSTCKHAGSLPVSDEAHQGKQLQASSAPLALPVAVSDPVVPFPAAACRAWLGQRCSVYPRRFFALSAVLLALVGARQVLEQRPQEAWSSAVVMLVLLAHAACAWRYPCWLDNSHAQRGLHHGMARGLANNQAGMCLLQPPFPGPASPAPFFMLTD